MIFIIGVVYDALKSYWKGSSWKTGERNNGQTTQIARALQRATQQEEMSMEALSQEVGFKHSKETRYRAQGW